MYTITNYTIKSELGQGGMATVYLAEDIKFLTNVAVKLLAKEFAHNENIRKRFLAEARNMFKMSHPNIIKVTDLIEEGDTVAFVMEYIEGETLKDYLERKGKLNNDEIKTIFTQILAAVAYVHEQGLIHRDIKPSNFMISPNGQVKLLDFGIAKNTDTNSAEYTQTSTSQQMGTPMYMSPEQVNETKSVTGQSDIYSLGVVLWQMVMGQKPYDTKTLSNFQLQSKIVNEKLGLTNTNWDTSIQKATHKNLESRYTSAQQFLNDLQNLGSIKDDKTIFENKDESTVIENSKAQTITPKIENAQPTSNVVMSNVEKEKKIKNRRWIWISILLVIVSIFIIGLIYEESLYPKNDIELEVLLCDKFWKVSELTVNEIYIDDVLVPKPTQNENIRGKLAKAFSDNPNYEYSKLYSIDYLKDIINKDVYIAFLNTECPDDNLWYFEKDYETDISDYTFKFGCVTIGKLNNRFLLNFEPMTTFIADKNPGEVYDNAVEYIKYNMLIKKITSKSLQTTQDGTVYIDGKKIRMVWFSVYSPYSPINKSDYEYLKEI